MCRVARAPLPPPHPPRRPTPSPARPPTRSPTRSASMPPRVASLVTDYGEQAGHCGYCGQEGQTSVSHGVSADTMTPEAYQALLDRCVCL